MTMIKDRKERKQAAIDITKQRLQLSVIYVECHIKGGGETTLIALKLSGDFLPAINKEDETEAVAEWVPVETGLKIIQMPRIVRCCERCFPKLAQWAISITLMQ